MYRALAKMYGWTFSEIADMSPWEQLQALDHTQNGNGTRTFRTEKEYEAYIKSRASNGQ